MKKKALQNYMESAKIEKKEKESFLTDRVHTLQRHNTKN
jgi:hypothetical protein